MVDWAQDRLPIEAARQWYLEQALPIWTRNGWDHERGGFHDKLSQSGEPERLPKRCRVQARQIYSILMYPAISGRAENPYLDLAERGMAYLLDTFRRGDGSFVFTVDAEGRHVDTSADNYDQAFVLFVLAHWYAADGNAQTLAYARDLLRFLKSSRQHPDWGFYEHDAIQGIQKTNPHMHYLEAFLEWAQSDPEGPWLVEAGQIVEGALQSVIDGGRGVVREFSGADWKSVKTDDKDVVEPGHLFEWATLLHVYGRLAGRSREMSPVVTKLYETATRFGVCEKTGLVRAALNSALEVTNGRSRLWMHTERIKASAIMLSENPGQCNVYKRHIREAWQCLQVYLDAGQPGLWYDWVDEGGAPIVEAAPASSLYHLTNAIWHMTNIETGNHG